MNIVSQNDIIGTVEDMVREAVATAIASGQISLLADTSFDDLCADVACNVSLTLIDKYNVEK